MAVSTKTRFEVFKRDSFKCQYCGQSAPDVVLHVDHIMPVAKGGGDDIINLITSCQGCNLGKSDRTLDDSTMLTKRKKQLDDLNERREQLEMLVQWQQELVGLDDEAAKMAAEFWEKLVGYCYNVNEKGVGILKKMIQRFGIQEVLESMRISAAQYFKFENPEDAEEPTLESMSKGWDYIAKIANTRRNTAGREYMRDIYYIRAILRNRLSYVNEYKAVSLMKDAYKAGVGVDDMKDIAKHCDTWTEFTERLEEEVEQAKSANEEAGK